MKALGWISSLSLILCGVPEVYAAYTSGTVGISWGLSILWFLGEITGLLYVINSRRFPLIFNYFINSILTGILLYMKISEVA